MVICGVGGVMEGGIHQDIMFYFWLESGIELDLVGIFGGHL